MIKIKLYTILISNLFMINMILILFKFLRLNYLMEIIVKQLQVNIDYVENQIGVDKDE